MKTVEKQVSRHVALLFPKDPEREPEEPEPAVGCWACSAPIAPGSRFCLPCLKIYRVPRGNE